MTIPVYCNQKTAKSLIKKFDYIFDRANLDPLEQKVLGGGIPQLKLHEFSDGFHAIEQSQFEFFSLPHGHMTTAGFKHGSMAYLVDCNSVPQSVAERLKQAQLDWLVLDCVQPAPHETHMGWDVTKAALEFIRPKKAGLIHMNHHWDHEELRKTLVSHQLDWAVPLKDGDVLHYS